MSWLGKERTYDDDVLELQSTKVPGDIGKLYGKEHLVEILGS